MIVRSDRGGEYYGRHMTYGQIPGPFAKFLQENGIKAQYSAPGEPQQNRVPQIFSDFSNQENYLP